MSNSQSLMLQALYDGLFGSFTSPPAGAPISGGGLKPADVFLSLNWPGTQIDMDDFADPWSPNNTDGNMFATENLSAMVDKIPIVFPSYSPSGQNISDVYSVVMTAHYDPPPPSPKDKAAYDDAFNFLNQRTTQTGYDSTGKKITADVWGDSDIYANYKVKLKAWDAAITSLLSKYLMLDMSKPGDQRQWSLLGGPLIDAVNSARDDLVAAQQSLVEDKLSVLAMSSENQVGQLFKAAQQNWSNSRQASVRNPGTFYHPAYAYPGNWFAPAAADGWTEMTISQGSLKTSEHSDFTKMGADVQASWGLWNVGGGFGKEDSHQSTSKDTTDLTVTFKYARVDIVRPWFDLLLFSVGGWDLGDAFAKGGLSNGNRADLTGAFPLLPTSFIAARDVKISAKWSHEDSSLIQSKLDTHASFGWGPFSISGSYSQGQSDKSFNSDFDGTTITNNGLQILGWVSSVVPLSPPTSASK